MANNIDALIEKMEAARGRLNVALDKVSPLVDIYPSWKLKQLMDHITGWDELVVSTLRAFARGEAPDKMAANGINEYNAISVGLRQGLSLEDSRLAYDVARSAVLRVLREVPEEKLKERFPAPWGGMCTIPTVIKIFSSHELEHAEKLEEVLNNQQQD